MRSDIERVRCAVAEALGMQAHEIKPETRFVDLGCDSLDLSEAWMCIEDEFAIQMLPWAECEKCIDLADAVALVQRRGRSAGKADG